MSTAYRSLLNRPSTPAQDAATGAAGKGLAAAGAGALVSLEDVLEALWQELAASRASGGGAGAAGRPYVLLNMIGTADGHATIDGRSGPLGTSADRELFQGLRGLVDAVLVGARTLRVERYNRIVDDPAARERRRERGLEAEALACVVSASLALDPDIPLLADPEARVALVTPSAGSLPAVAASLDYVRCGRDGVLDMAGALRMLRERLDVGLLLCEGGPHLAGQLLADGLVDELFLTLAPLLAGGDIASSPTGAQGMRRGEQGDGGGAALPLLSGAALDPPARLELLSALESESYLFLRYRVAR